VVCAEAGPPSSEKSRRLPIEPSEPLLQLWPICEPVLVEAVRSLHPPGRVVEYSDVLQEAAVFLAEYLRANQGAVTPAILDREALRRQLVRRIREYVRAERRRMGRQITANDETLERALARRAGASPGGAAGRTVARAIERLSPQQRAVVAALYFRDEKVAELAAHLNVTPQAVTALHRRAIAALRRALERSDGQHPES